LCVGTGKTLCNNQPPQKIEAYLISEGLIEK